MSRISEAWRALTGKAATQIGRPFASYNLVNGQFVSVDDNKTSYITNGYTINDQLYSIVNLILDKVKMPEWGTYKVVDEASLKAYNGIMRRKGLTSEDYKKAQEYRRKALEPVESGKLTELMKYPNEYQSMQELMTELIGYKLLTGDYYQWSETLQAGANAGKPFAFHSLPSDKVTILAQNKTFPIVEAGYTLADVNVNFEKDTVLHGKYWNPEWDSMGSHLYGMSPIKAALKKLTRNNSALRASGAMYQNQGVKGVLYVDDPRVLSAGVSAADTGKQANAVKDLLRKEWTGEDNFGKIGTSGYKMGWQEIGMSPVDLNIIESEKWDYIGLCNIYGVPPELLGLTAKTYNNMKEAETALTSRVALPQLVSYRDSLNRWLFTKTAYKGSGVVVDFDQTCFTELQEDVKEKSTWVTPLLAKGLPLNRALDLLGLERVDDPVFDKPWVTTEMGMPIDEWNIEPDGSGENSI